MGTQFGVSTTMLLGQVMLGGISSMRTLTLKQQALLVLFASRQQTDVVPGGNTLPDGGLQTGVKMPEQVSPAVTVKLTAVPERLVVNTVMLVEQAIIGGVVSLTTTVRKFVVELPLRSVAA